MAAPQRDGIPHSSFWSRRWHNLEPPLGALIEDGILLLVFVFILIVAYLALGVLALFGYDPVRVDTFETIHYYAYLVVFATLMLDLIIQVLLHTVRKK